MTTTAFGQPRRPHRAGWAPFVRHYIEMVLAMVIGTVALMPLQRWAVQAVGAVAFGRSQRPWHHHHGGRQRPRYHSGRHYTWL